MSDEQLLKLVDLAAHQLGEHFSAVQILVSWEKDANGNTADIMRGTGNWYARAGMAREFLERDRAHTTAYEISKSKDGEDED